ncbi:MAG: hypothetical protein H0Z39_03585 [Peptococcaceae bacterium]|nr:hypothetical protein [Peptococcaceae bacterium]
MDVAIRLSNGIGGGRFIIAVTNWNRCGCLGPYTDITASDVQQYIGLENPVDAATLAAALNNIFGDL